MFNLKNLSTVRRRRTVEIEEEEIDDGGHDPVIVEPSRPAARIHKSSDPWDLGIGPYIIIAAVTIFLGFMFARAILGGGGGLPDCQALPLWNPNAPCR